MRQWEIHTWRSWSRGVVSRRTMIEEEVRMKKRWVVIWTGSKRPLYSIQFFMPTYSYVVAKQCLLSITHIILWVPVGITLSSHTPNTLSPFSFTSQQISVKQRLAHPLTIPISTSVSPFNSVLSRDPRRRKSRMYACTEQSELIVKKQLWSWEPCWMACVELGGRRSEWRISWEGRLKITGIMGDLRYLRIKSKI